MTQRMMTGVAAASRMVHVIENAKRPVLVFVHCIAFWGQCTVPAMSADCPRFLAIVGAVGALLLNSTVAAAAPKDDAAEDLAKKAIYTDYLGTKFDEAEKKLKKAIALCKPSGACSKNVKATLYCDLGIVYAGGMNRNDDAKAQFALALEQDPKVVPDSDLVSPEIEALFAEAKKGGGGGGKQPAGEPGPAPAGGGSGDLVHTPPAEQATLTPVPLFAQLPAGTTAARVQLSYKPFGASEWKALEMKPHGKGYGVEVPCVEIGSAQGDLSYYIQAFDAQQNLVSWSGTRQAPNKVPIRSVLQGDAPHLPGLPPPAKCADTGDCPPEFPGCKGHDDKKPSCDPADPDCKPEEEKPAFRKNWISISVQQDFLVMPANTNTCFSGTVGGVAYNSPYDCFDLGGNYYKTNPYMGSGDVVNGGVSVATTRLLAGYDRVIVAGFALGVRLGAAFRGGPTVPTKPAFLPFHGEIRASYWFGSDPFSRTVRPYILINGGVAQVDGSVSVILYQNAMDYMNDTRSTYKAWRKAGTEFVGGGVGLMLAPGPRHGLFLEFKVAELLPTTGTSFNLAIGYALGL
jgi:hypothetical protein